MSPGQIAAIRSPLTGPADTVGGPTPRFVGDLWWATTTGNGFTANTLYEHNGTSWLLVSTPGGDFGTPNLTLGTANAAGTANTAVRTDATILAFDATVPVTQAFGDAAATGSATTTARRDHKHGMPAAPTSGMTLITDTLLGADTASVTFSSIPGTYKDLMVLMQSRGDGAVTVENVALQFNGDTATNYDLEEGRVNNGAANNNQSAGASNMFFALQPGANATRAGVASSSTLIVPNYASTTFEKSCVSQSGATDSTAGNLWAMFGHGGWRNTAAITAIKIFPGSSANFKTGSRFTLFGLS